MGNESSKEESLCFKFVGEEVVVSDDFKISGGMFDGFYVEEAILICRKKSSVCFSHCLENHIRCVVYLAIQKLYDSLKNPTPFIKAEALIQTFSPVMTDLIDAMTKENIDLVLIDNSNDIAWTLIGQKIVFFLKNYCYKSRFDSADRYLRSKEITELVEKLAELLNIPEAEAEKNEELQRELRRGF